MAFLLGLFALAGLAAGQQTNAELKLAKTYTSWDCCKPVCAQGNYNTNLLTERGMVKVCNKDNTPMEFNAGLRSTSGCQNGNSFLCGDYSPVPVSEDLSYGFAIMVGGETLGNNPSCCKCYELEWLTGAAENKKMVVQVINIASGNNGGSENAIRNGDLIILTPGGGVGPYNAGCNAQFGNQFARSWGPQYGGHTSAEGCAGLPAALQGGCYWRFNWARGTMNGWDIVYKEVQCPARLTDISACRWK